MLPCPGFRRSCRGHRVRAFPPAKAEYQEEAAAESGAADRRNRRDVQKARPGRCAAVGTDPPFSGRCRHTTLHAGRGIRSVLRRSGRDGGRAVGRCHPRRPAAFTRGKIQVQTQERHQQRKDPDGSVRAAIPSPFSPSSAVFSAASCSSSSFPSLPWTPCRAIFSIRSERCS